eukprot:TRINITY_DN1623_c0_g1_i2.p1 TRINITY_DN1623_c0_g1~~TRINITY_DN1623_c0_g1_i2.p1  ORF type:complete len:865 (-),score=153.27 TRINITY_DN1623_c0_g1_i2:311-2596(-)
MPDGPPSISERSLLPLGGSRRRQGRAAVVPWMEEEAEDAMEISDAWQRVCMPQLGELFAREWKGSHAEFCSSRHLHEEAFDRWIHEHSENEQFECAVRDFLLIAMPQGPPPEQVARDGASSPPPQQQNTRSSGGATSNGVRAEPRAEPTTDPWGDVSAHTLRKLFKSTWMRPHTSFSWKRGISGGTFARWVRGKSHSMRCERAVRDYLRSIAPAGPAQIGAGGDGAERKGDAWDEMSDRHLRALFAHKWTGMYKEFTSTRGLSAGTFSSWLHGRGSMACELAVREYLRAAMPEGPPPISEINALPPPKKLPPRPPQVRKAAARGGQQSSVSAGTSHDSTAHDQHETETETETEKVDTSVERAWKRVSVEHLQALFVREWKESQKEFSKAWGLSDGMLSPWLRGKKNSPTCESTVREYLRSVLPRGPPSVAQLDLLVRYTRAQRMALDPGADESDGEADDGEAVGAWWGVSSQHLRALFLREWTEVHRDFIRPRGLSASTFSAWLHGRNSIPCDNAVREYLVTLYPDGPPPLSELDLSSPSTEAVTPTRSTRRSQSSDSLDEPSSPGAEAVTPMRRTRRSQSPDPSDDGAARGGEVDAWDALSADHLRKLFAREWQYMHKDFIRGRGLSSSTFSGWWHGKRKGPLCEDAVRAYLREVIPEGPPSVAELDALPRPAKYHKAAVVRWSAASTPLRRTSPKRNEVEAEICESPVSEEEDEGNVSEGSSSAGLALSTSAPGEELVRVEGSVPGSSDACIFFRLSSV